MDLVVVEVVIGLAFLFFVISIVSSAVNEGISGILKLRARTLERGVVNLLTGSAKRLHQLPEGTEGLGFVWDVFANPLLDGYRHGDPLSSSVPPTTEGGKVDRKIKVSSYLASRSFRNALLDTASRLPTTGKAQHTDAAQQGADAAQQGADAAQEGTDAAQQGTDDP